MNEYGILDNDADLLAFVCYDQYPGIGRKIHVGPIFPAQQAILEAKAFGEKVIGGRRFEEEVTGLGYLRSPASIGLKAYDAEKYLTEPYDGAAAEEAAKNLFRDLGYNILPPTTLRHDFRIERNGKIESVEVKSRGPDKAFPEVFLQIAESNPKRLVA